MVLTEGKHTTPLGVDSKVHNLTNELLQRISRSLLRNPISQYISQHKAHFKRRETLERFVNRIERKRSAMSHYNNLRGRLLVHCLGGSGVSGNALVALVVSFLVLFRGVAGVVTLMVTLLVLVCGIASVVTLVILYVLLRGITGVVTLMMTFLVLVYGVTSMVTLVVTLLVLLRGITGMVTLVVTFLVLVYGVTSMMTLVVLFRGVAGVVTLVVALLVLFRGIAGRMVMVMVIISLRGGTNSKVTRSIVYRKVAAGDVWDDRCCGDTEEDERDERLGKTHDEQRMGS